LVRVRFLDPKVEINEDVTVAWLGTSERVTYSPKLSGHLSLRECSNRLKTHLTSSLLSRKATRDRPWPRMHASSAGKRSPTRSADRDASVLTNAT